MKDYETEPQRLQREADVYTKQLEHARKKNLILGDTKRQMHQQINSIYEEIKVKAPNKEKEKSKKVARDSLHHRISNLKVRLNDMIGGNHNYRVDIDIARKEILFAKSSVDEMTAQIKTLKEQSIAANRDQIVSANEANEIDN